MKINKYHTQFFKFSKSHRENRYHLLWFLMFYFLTAASSPVNVSEKVSKDIAKYKQFEAQSEVLRKRYQSDFVTIGADAACDFDSAVDSIQVAIDSGAAEVRVATNGTYLNNLTIENQSIIIRGGFVDCVAAQANQTVLDQLTVIDGALLAEPVLYITGSEMVHNIWLENLILKNGTSLFPKFGGGISLDLAAVDLQMLRVVMQNNTGSAGVGMNIDAGAGASAVETQVTGREILIIGNDASGLGGGLACRGFAEVSFGGLSLFSNNSANLGGAMYLFNGCSVSMYSEFFEDTLSFFAGLHGNISAAHGGGAYVNSGADLYLFGQRMCDKSACIGSNRAPIVVQNNVSGTDEVQAGHGGGIYLAQIGNLAHFYANGLFMAGNTSDDNAGGVYVGSSSVAVIERQAGGCWHEDRCNLIIDNSSGIDIGLGGAFYVADGGELNIAQTYLEENRADFGTTIYASGQNAVVNVTGSVFDDNGNDGDDGFLDFSVISASLGAVISVTHSTFADNNAQNSVFDIDPALGSSMTLSNSIVHDPGTGNVFGPVSGPLDINCLLAHENTSFSGSGVVVTDPLFVDRLNGDFHLSSISPAIDRCQAVTMQYPLDIDAEVRAWDDPSVNNGLGIYDAGADESYVNDVIFENNFESL